MEIYGAVVARGEHLTARMIRATLTGAMSTSAGVGDE